MYPEFNKQSAGLDMLLMHNLCTLYILGNLIMSCIVFSAIVSLLMYLYMHNFVYEPDLSQI